MMAAEPTETLTALSAAIATVVLNCNKRDNTRALPSEKIGAAGIST
jgi:hypothetical protein